MRKTARGRRAASAAPRAGRKFRCPKCRTLVSIKGPSFPLCSKCGEYLLKCRYCQYLDTQTRECTNPDVVDLEASGLTASRRVQDIDAIVNCDLHAATIVYDPRREAARVLRTALIAGIIALAVGLAAYAAVLGYTRVSEAEKKPDIEVRVSYDEEVDVEDTLNISFYIRNLRKEDSGQLLLRMSQGFFEWFELQSVNPMAQNIEVKGSGRWFTFPSVPGNSEMMISMRFKPTAVGRYQVDASLFAPGRVNFTERKLRIDVI